MVCEMQMFSSPRDRGERWAVGGSSVACGGGAGYRAGETVECHTQPGSCQSSRLKSICKMEPTAVLILLCKWGHAVQIKQLKAKSASSIF